MHLVNEKEKTHEIQMHNSTRGLQPKYIVFEESKNEAIDRMTPLHRSVSISEWNKIKKKRTKRLKNSTISLSFLIHSQEQHTKNDFIFAFFFVERKKIS